MQQRFKYIYNVIFYQNKVILLIHTATAKSKAIRLTESQCLQLEKFFWKVKVILSAYAVGSSFGNSLV